MIKVSLRPPAAGYRLPIQETVRDLVGDLLGRPAMVLKQAEPLADAAVAVVATYVNEADKVATVALCNLGFANGVGAALSLVPIPIAREATAAGEVPDNLLENVQEVLNVMARLFNTATAPHVRLQGVHRGTGDLPASAAALLASPRSRKDFAVDVEGYGPGRVALLAS